MQKLKKKTNNNTATGKNLAVFRGEDGKANVIDAYCPHNGANLAVGGVVKDNCLECPFHGWRFQGDGKCVHIPYTEQKYSLVLSVILMLKIKITI